VAVLLGTCKQRREALVQARCKMAKLLVLQIVKLGWRAARDLECEMVRCRRQRAIRNLAQRRIDGQVYDCRTLFGNSTSQSSVRPRSNAGLWKQNPIKKRKGCAGTKVKHVLRLDTKNALGGAPSTCSQRRGGRPCSRYNRVHTFSGSVIAGVWASTLAGARCPFGTARKAGSPPVVESYACPTMRPLSSISMA
jgi:hypothetical protein